jgi:hypothetical protein
MYANAHNVESVYVAAHSARAPKPVARHAQRLASFARDDKPPMVSSVILLFNLIHKEEIIRNDS